MYASEPRHAPRRERGLSIIELMVAMVIALIIGMAASGSARVFTASQRQGIGVGGTSAGLASTMAAIKGDVASAGLGFFGNSKFLCYKLDLSVGTSAKYDGANFSPLLVTSQGASDQLDTVSASVVDGGTSVLLKGTSDGTSASLTSLLPVSASQAVLLAPATPGNPCLVRTVTAVTDATSSSPQVLTFANTGTHNQKTFTTTPSFADRDGAALLGTLGWSRYRVSGTNLLVEHPLDGTSATLLRNVLAFRVQYGVGANSSATTLDSWQDAAGTYASLNGASVDNVRALRIGIVTRSPQREKENSSGNCDASSAKPTDPFNSAVTVEPDVTDWQCYRYRSAIAIVPLRNLAW